MDPDAIDDVERAPHGGSDDPDVIDFSANTNPRVPGGARRVYRETFDASRRYPDDGYPEYRRAAAVHVDGDVGPGTVVPTGGGLAALRLAISTTVSPGDTALVPAPSFGEYAREIRLCGGEPRFVAPADLLDADPEPHALAVACTP